MKKSGVSKTCSPTVHVLLVGVKLDEFKRSLEEVTTKEPPEEDKPKGELTMEDVTPYVTEAQKEGFLQKYEVWGTAARLKSEIHWNLSTTLC